MTTPLRRAQIVVLATALLKLVGGLAVWAGGVVDGADYPGAFPPWVHAVHVIVFSSAGLLLIAGGRTDVRPRHLGSLFVLLGASFSDRLLVAAAGAATGPVASLAATLAILQPEAFVPFVFWRFVNDFPRVESAPGLQRLIRAGITISLAAACVLAASNLLLQSPLRDLVSAELAAQLRPLSRMPREGSIFWTVLIVLQIPAYLLMFRKVPFAAPGERRRVAMFVAGMVACGAPMMIDVALESFIPAFARFMNQPTPRMLSGVICYSALLSVTVDDRLRRVGGTRDGRAPRGPQGHPVRSGQDHNPLRGCPSRCRPRISALPAARPDAGRTADWYPVADACRRHADLHRALPRAQAAERRARPALLPRAVRFAGSARADRGSRPQHRRRDHVCGVRGNGDRPQHPRRAGDCAPRPAGARAACLSRRRRSTAGAFRWPRGASQRRHQPARARFRRRALAAAPLVARRA